MEVVDDGHRFRLAYFRKHWDTHMHNGDTFALDVVRERYRPHGTKNIGDNGGGSRNKFKNVRPARETAATRTTFTKDVAKDVNCTEATRVRYLAWIAERGTIGAGSLQPYLSAINTFLGHIGRNEAQDTGPAIIDMKRTIQIRQLKTSEELRRAHPPCDGITDNLDDLATLPTTTNNYGMVLCDGAAVCSTFMFSSHGGSNVSCRLRDMAVDAHNITLCVNREKAGHRKRRDGFKPLLQIPPTAVPTWTSLLRQFVIYGDAAFRASPFAKQPDRFWALLGDGGMPLSSADSSSGPSAA
eukprot:jgi/Tetstr1/454851/TSEL_004039.t1